MGKTKSELWCEIRKSRFIAAYVECIVFTEELSEEFDGEFDIDNLDRDALVEIIRDCTNFLEIVESQGIEMVDNRYGYEQAGHDFWLTRNGHGAGFWDRGLGEIGDKLSKIAKSFGSSYVYRTDRGKIAIG